MRLTLPLIALAALTSPVLAAEDVVNLRVSYADFDVTSEAGRAAPEARVAAKLRKVCTIEGVSRDTFNRTRRDEKCLSEGLASARAEVKCVAATEQRRGREIAAN